MRIYKRFKESKIKFKYLTGNISLQSIPWLFILIIFWGLKSFKSGIERLELFFINLISPKSIESIRDNLLNSYHYNSHSTFDKIIYFVSISLVTVLLAPLLEELFFRGILMHRLAAKWGIVWSILLSSIFFGLAHLDSFVFSRVGSAVIYTLAYFQTKMLIVPIILHLMNNGLVLINSIIYNFDFLNSSEITLQYFWSGITNIGFSLPIFIYFFKLPKSLDSLPYLTNKKKEENQTVN